MVGNCGYRRTKEVKRTQGMLQAGWERSPLELVSLRKAVPDWSVTQGGQIFKEGLKGQPLSAAGQGRLIQRVGIPPRKVGQPPGSESLEIWW
jgi:hypothetical protein